MSTPSHSFPYSPSPQSPSFSGSVPPSPVIPPPTEERRRSKRESTASATRRREEAANRYPSPPPVGTRSRPVSIDASLTIPPFNPNNRRQPAGAASPSPSASSSTTSSRRDSQPVLDERVAGLMPAPVPSQFHQQHAHRPASTTIVPVASPIPPHVSQSVSSRSRQSVGYLPTQPTASSAGPYPQLYTPHQMPRQKIYFGPYILLQTLGEGEFGKVKLGVHSERWGEDVAIKLIKRGNVDTAQRGEKVRREIEVLKAVRHPNIVRLYDVIETEKYIGIVIEYASGGELFDHILAHRYLKERDASRLFAQLISGVSYLHAKGVVHRDLKLENLLLDRNRNCIITDFGFANRFNDPNTDLMATSCGSPCYAAPELVVQEGKYIGTAVDVWSCGVILYAMLAGYLPYDDDPANPEGDNINLLYKYIISTPLSFPDWITPEPRDLLLRMLVPDPQHRCTIEDVTRHSWLRKFAPAFTKSVEELEQQAQDQEIFKRQALEAQRQWLIQQQQRAMQQQQMPGGGAQGMTRSQTTMGGMSGPPSAGTRHRSAMVTSTSSPHGMGIDMQQQQHQHQHQPQHLPPSVPEEVPAAIPRPITIAPIPSSSHPNRRSGAFVPTSPTTTETHRISVDADPFSFEPRTASPPASVPMQPSFSAPPDPPSIHEDQTMFEASPAGAPRSRTPSTATAMEGGTPASGTRSRRSSVKPVAPSAAELAQSAEEAERERRKKANRATVQVEYDGGAQRRAAARQLEPVATALPVPENVVEEPVLKEQEDVVMTPVESEFTAGTVDLAEPVATTDPSANLPTSTPLSSSTILENVAMRSSTPPLVPIPFPSTPPVVASPSPSASTPKKRKSSGSPNAVHTAPSIPADPLPAPPTQANVDATPKAKKSSATPSDASARPPSVASNVSRHKHGMSADRFSLRSLLSGSTTSLERPGGGKSSTEAEKEKEKAALDEVTNRRKSRRQKALSLQPFRHSTSSKVPKNATKADLPPPTPSSKSRPRSSTVTQANQAAGSMGPPPRPSSTAQRPNTRSSAASPAPHPPRSNSTDLEANWSSAQAGSTPSGKAKAVMDWFRRRSTRGYPSTTSAESSHAPIPTDFDRSRPSSRMTAATASTTEMPSSSNASMRDGSVTPIPPPSIAESTPSVVVTAAALPPPVSIPPTVSPSTTITEQSTAASSRSASGGAPSHFSQKSSSTVATSVTGSGSTVLASAPISTATAIAPFPSHKLRVHQGALDRQALTYRAPSEVFAEVRAALWNMGVDASLEGEFKIKCVRKSKKKALAASAGGSTNSAHSISPLNNSHSSNASSRRESATVLPSSPSLSSTLAPSPSMGFRSLFTRKGSGGTLTTLNTATGPNNSPSVGSTYSASFSPELDQSPLSPSISQFGAFAPPPAASQPLPVYGEGSTDQGDEVRFYVELTRVKHLEGLYCVDVKRMKGAAFSYQCVYRQLVGRLELGQV